MDEATRKVLKDIGMSEKDIDGLSLEMLKYLANRHRLSNYKIIAEVTDFYFCLRGLKPGDRYVFRYAELLP